MEHQPAYIAEHTHASHEHGDRDNKHPAGMRPGQHHHHHHHHEQDVPNGTFLGPDILSHDDVPHTHVCRDIKPGCNQGANFNRLGDELGLPIKVTHAHEHSEPGHGYDWKTYFEEGESEPALMGRFDSMPERHDGTKRITAKVTFSEPIDASEEEMSEHGVQVEGGRVRSARRAGPGGDDGAPGLDGAWRGERRVARRRPRRPRAVACADRARLRDRDVVRADRRLCRAVGPGRDLALRRARGLLAHEASGFRESGASASLTWDPRPSTDRGLALTLRQSWRGSPTGGMDARLGRETLAGLAANDNGAATASAGRLGAELGYGIALFDGAFTGTPHLGVGLSESGRDYRLGWRLTSARRGDPGFEIGLDATRREAANADAEHGIALRGTIRW